MTAPLFDEYVMVDWSAASVPRLGADSIWIGRCHQGRTSVENVATRRAALSRLQALCKDAVHAARRVLVGFDFPFGYPRGVARHVTGRAEARALWDWLAARLQDGPDNDNNRFDVAAALNRLYSGTGPFWGRPQSWDFADIPTRATERMGADHPPERRLSEAMAPTAKPVWQLAYAGAVGSQVITGLPVVKALREDPALAAHAAVWPFDTGLRTPKDDIVLAEIYPSLHAPDPAHAIKDAGQVSAVAKWLAAEDRAGTMPGHFAGPTALSAAERALVETEEAWILGLGTSDDVRGETT